MQHVKHSNQNIASGIGRIRNRGYSDVTSYLKKHCFTGETKNSTPEMRDSFFLNKQLTGHYFCLQLYTLMLNHIFMINPVLTQNPQKSSYDVTSEYPRNIILEGKQ